VILTFDELPALAGTVAMVDVARLRTVTK